MNKSFKKNEIFEEDDNLKKNQQNFTQSTHNTRAGTKNIININTPKITQKNINSTVSNEDDFCNINKLNNFLKENYKIFYKEFELSKFLSSGSTGYVYEGKYKNAKNIQKYAFKFVMKKLLKEKEKEKKEEKEKEKEKKEEKNYYNEISIQKKLHHKNINQILAFFKIDKNSYFSVSELGKYGDLDNFSKNLLKRKTLSETCINYLAKQLLDALEYIHRCKIIHMDIKPGNILIDSDLNPKIIDFSASCNYSSFNPEDLVKFPFIGTSRYIAPEIINRTHMKIKFAEKIDIYSFGVTLYFLIFGIFPYNLNNIDSKNYDEILKNVKNEELQFPSDTKISEKLKDFFKGVLNKDYQKRFTIREAQNHPWIQASKILEDEKLNTSCQKNFLIKLITDNYPKFNQSIN